MIQEEDAYDSVVLADIAGEGADDDDTHNRLHIRGRGKGDR